MEARIGPLIIAVPAAAAHDRAGPVDSAHRS
jgi:hypothetical protein